MSSVKERIIDIVNDQPDDSSFDEILNELVFDLRIQRGLKDIDEGRVISDEEMEERIEQWSKSSGLLKQNVG